MFQLVTVFSLLNKANSKYKSHWRIFICSIMFVLVSFSVCPCVEERARNKTQTISFSKRWCTSVWLKREREEKNQLKFETRVQMQLEILFNGKWRQHGISSSSTDIIATTALKSFWRCFQEAQSGNWFTVQFLFNEVLIWLATHASFTHAAHTQTKEKLEFSTVINFSNRSEKTCPIEKFIYWKSVTKWECFLL